MNVDYILRKDIDRFKIFLDELEALMEEKGIDSNDIEELLSQYCDMQQLEIVRNELMSMITQYEPSNTFSLSNFKEVDGFVSSGVTVKVYSDDLSIYVKFSGKASDFDTNNRLLLGTLDSKYGAPSTFVYAPVINVSSGIVLGAVSIRGEVYILNYSNLKSVPVTGGVYYPLKQRIDNPTGGNVLTSYDMTQYYTKTVVDGLLSLKSDNINTLTDIELLDDGRINLKYIGDE